MPTPIAIWNSARDAWEKPGTENLFCEHLAVYSETFPTSGMTSNGAAYELPTWERRTHGSESSSSPDDAMLGTPTSRMWKGAGPQGGPTQIRNKARGLIEAQVMDIEPQLLQTPTAALAGGVQTLEVQVGGRQKYKALPTPTVSDTNGAGKHGDGGLDLRTAVSLLPTPKASDGEKGGPNQRGSSGDWPLPAIGHLLPTPTTQPETGNGHARNLGKEAKLLQTPSVADALGGHERRGGKRGKELLLNGQAKALAALPTPRATRGGSSTETMYLLSGASMSPPSDAGNELSDGTLPGQQSLLDVEAESA